MSDLAFAPPATVTAEDRAAAKKSRANLPTMSDLRKFPGFREDESGWSIPLGETGRRNANHEYAEMMKPFARSEATRARSRRPLSESVRLRDASGAVRMVPAHLERATAIKNGWRPARRPKCMLGTPEFGPDGMLFRPIKGGWEPMGVRCLGTPLKGSARVPCRGIQRDPSGRLWRGLGREWVRVA